MKNLLRFIFVFNVFSLGAMEKQDSQLGAPEDSQNGKEEAQEIVPAFPFPRVSFSPGIQDVILNIIDHEDNTIAGALYRFTLYPIAEKIVNKKIKAGFIVDGEYKKDSCAALRLLAQNGASIAVRNQNPSRFQSNPGKFSIMHHKFAYFENNFNKKPLVITGSFNWTGQANTRNDENLVILNDHESVEKFRQELKDLCKEKKALTAADLKCESPRHPLARQMNGIPNGIQD